MPGTIAMSYKDKIVKHNFWHSPCHRKKIIESWRRESAKVWQEVVLIITIDDTVIKNKIFPPKKSPYTSSGKLTKIRKGINNSISNYK